MKWKVQDGVIVDEVGEELVLTLPSGDMAVLNPSAAAVYEAVCGCACYDTCDGEDFSQTAAAHTLQERFGLNLEVASRDARKAIRQLKSARVLIPVREAIPHGKPYERVTRRAFVGGMAATGLSLLGGETALGQESAKAAERAYAGADLGMVDEGQNMRVWTDSLGNSVEVPLSISKVSPYGPYAQALLESIDPSLVVQTTARGAHASVKASTAAACESIARGADGEGAISVDALEEEAPDLVLDIAANEEMLCTSVDATADEAGVPIAHLVIGVGELPQAYRALGKLLGCEDRCNELADYVASIDVALAQVRERVAEEDKKRVYLGGYSSERVRYACDTVAGSMLTLIGAENVSVSDAFKSNKSVSMAAIKGLAPDSLLLLDVEDESRELNVLAWQAAFSPDKVEVLFVPERYWAVFDRNPLLVQTAGVQVMASLVYPDLFRFDVDAWNEGPFSIFQL